MNFIFWAFILTGISSVFSNNCHDRIFPDLILFCSHQEVDILCKSSSPSVWTELLSARDVVDLPEIDLKITNCSLDDDFRISVLKDALEVEKIRKIHIKNPTSRLKGIHFQGLSESNKLIIEGDISEDLDPHLLSNLHHLFEFSITLSNFRDIPLNFFQNSTHLEILEITHNSYWTVLKNYHFSGLRSLKELGLWANSIGVLESEVFQDLINLETLDIDYNNLTTLPASVFKNLQKLQVISLDHNNLKSLPEGLFSIPNSQLRRIDIRSNGLLSTLPNGLFRNLYQLKNISLKNNSLENIPKDVFHGAHNLSTLDLSDNALNSDFPMEVFFSNRNLKDLSFKRNKITVIRMEIFQKIISLESLDLSWNDISILPENFLHNLSGLQKLNISHNNLKNIGDDGCKPDAKLKILDLSYNYLDMTRDGNLEYSAIKNCLKLEHLNLSHNRITTIFPDWLTTFTSLTNLDLKNNKIYELKDDHLHFKYNVTVDLQHNQIESIHLDGLENEIRKSNNSNKHIKNIFFKLYSNPINCDCKLLNFVKLIQGKLDETIERFVSVTDVNQLRCSNSSYSPGARLLDISSRELRCPIKSPEVCFPTCNCSNYSWNYTEKQIFEIDCSYRNFTELPKFINNSMNWFINLNMTGNNLGNNIQWHDWLNSVEVLSLGENNIDIFKPNITFKSLKVLELHNNKLTGLDQFTDDLKNISTLERLNLADNPWDCSCEIESLVNFLKSKPYLLGTDSSQVSCNNNKIDFLIEYIPDRCHTLLASENIYLLIACLGLLVAVFSVFFYYYHAEIESWIYSKKYLKWLVTEEDLDRDKKYDAFISYSHKDEDFVMNEIIPKLENGTIPYKLCFHSRDWLAGEYIPDQIARSVEDSRRTIVILSPNFLESVWGKIEFRTAHSQAANEGRSRVIAVIYGDINLTDNNIDPELKAYLHMNTYLKWGDPWFWNKLVFKMPHRKPNLPRRTNAAKLIEQHLVTLNSTNYGESRKTDSETLSPTDSTMLLQTINGSESV